MAQVPSSACTLLASSAVIPVESVKTLALLLFFAGFYVLLFTLAVYLRCTLPTTTNKILHLSWLISLFLFSNTSAAARTAQVIISTRSGTMWSLSCAGSSFDRLTVVIALVALYHMTFIITNGLSDSIMIYRLSVIWGPQRRQSIYVLVCIMILISFLAFTATALTAVGQNDPAGLVKVGNIMGLVYDSCNAVFNLTLTLMLASHIWQINHKAQAVLSPVIQRRYKTIIAILLESGILYPLTLFLHVAIFGYYLAHNTSDAPIDIGSLPMLMAGIAPTLIILRSTLNKSTEPSVNQGLSTLRFEERDVAGTLSSVNEVMSTSRSSTGIQRIGREW